MKLRIVEVPYRYDERHDGLGRGPRALLDAGLVDRLRETPVGTPDVVTAELPESERVDGPVAVNIGRLGANVGALVGEGHDHDERVLVLAGDDTAAVGVVSGLQQSRGAAHRIGVVWFDAHGDFNTPETSVSNILAGMPLAILAGLAGPLWREAAMLAATIPTDRIVVAGIRELDDAEEQLLTSTDVRLLRQEDALAGTTFADVVAKLADRVEDLYVHIDLDVLDPSLVPSSSTPSPRGMSLQQLEGLLDVTFRTGKVAVLAVAGLNPGGGQRGQQSVKSTKALLESVVPRWVGRGAGPMSDDQRTAAEAVFAELIDRGEVDVAPAEEGSGIEIRADSWTLAIDGDPMTVAFLAVDDEPGDPADLDQALKASLEPDDLAALRALDHRWDGALRIALQQSGDILSMQLATLLAEEPDPQA